GRAAVDRLIEHGGRGARTIAEAVAEATVVITMVPDSPDVEGAAYGDDGIYANAEPGTLHIDCSSIRPDVARQLSESGLERGVCVIDAPVSGGQAGAVEATLSIMVGGADADVAVARPLLEKMGKTIVHVGPSGSGQTVKAANQLMVAGHLALLAEAIVFLEAHDVDTEAAITVLAGGLAGSTVLDRKAAGMLQRSFDPGFRVDLHHKDLGIVTSSARAAGVAIPLGAHVAQLMGTLRAQGHGQLDHSALLLLVDQLSGRTHFADDTED
ncbi:MAG: NAD-binding protein, partial [Dermatophilaceae bacterium]|nr:NAD-binding protein [Dermatophilaceae bacterium]